MHFSRFVLRCVCGLLISLLLLTQSAIASYVCPSTSSSIENVSASVHDCLPSHSDVAKDENLNLCRASCSELEPVAQELGAHNPHIEISHWSYPVQLAVAPEPSTWLDAPNLIVAEPALSVLFCCYKN